MKAEPDTPIACRACGASELVRAYLGSNVGSSSRKGARCLVCGHRFAVDDSEFADLRPAALGEPHENLADKYKYLLRLKMSKLHALVCVAGAVFGVVLAVRMVIRFDQPLFGFIFLPITWAAWWIGRWLSPPIERIPGKCPECRYDLRKLPSNRCPECGRILDPNNHVRPEEQRTTGDGADA